MATSVEQLEKLVGQVYAAVPVSSSPAYQSRHLSTTPQVGWNKRDLLTYAIGIGAKTSERQFVYGAVLRLPVCSSLYIRLTLLPHSRTWYIISHLVRCALNIPSLDPSFAAFPTFPVALFLKGI